MSLLWKQRLEYRKGKSDKFYLLTLRRVPDAEDDVTPYHVRRRWGRIGSRGQDKVERFAYRSQALKHVKELRASKLEKGYVASGPPEEYADKKPSKKTVDPEVSKRQSKAAKKAWKTMRERDFAADFQAFVEGEG